MLSTVFVTSKLPNNVFQGNSSRSRVVHRRAAIRVGAGGRAGRPDLAGGAILTMDDAAMRAEAVAAKGGRIIAVGTAGQVLALRGPETEVIDLAGRAMVPGFVDPHGHIVLGGLQALSANLLPRPTVRATALQRCSRRCVTGSQPMPTPWRKRT
jgi:hypothetical protein